MKWKHPSVVSTPLSFNQDIMWSDWEQTVAHAGHWIAAADCVHSVLMSLLSLISTVLSPPCRCSCVPRMCVHVRSKTFISVITHAVMWLSVSLHTVFLNNICGCIGIGCFCFFFLLSTVFIILFYSQSDSISSAGAVRCLCGLLPSVHPTYTHSPLPQTPSGKRLL